jgi:hypothetical protein
MRRTCESQIESLRDEHRNKTLQLEESLRAAREQAVQNALKSAREQSEQHVSIVEQSVRAREAEIAAMKVEMKRLQDQLSDVRENVEKEERARAQTQVHAFVCVCIYICIYTHTCI